MRSKTIATLAAVGLATAAVATASAASASDAPHVERGTRVLSGDVLRGVHTKSAATARGNLRLSGADRYATAVEISRVVWDQDNTVAVFLASGTSPADALALGGSFGGSGPVLLTERDSLPAATRAELARLRPCFLVVAGGAASVSDAVFADAEQYTDPTGCPAQ
jgi:ell wall binding domain 2 (CWB2)